ncbi:16S rRNA (guanine(527)-N(7))-methyltransferase RsmG [Clostridium sp. Marseille-P299]|uniref:16S rRNA (guanine(527)-N(7))-methyltransferase RsmG n=1 Tax=Clostridium sp. Marseille-P299 TaxID=1805477 RepID=UPI000833A49B|nr:16S rRNA (guanine(527)-N(7))-methyltransferase RsmG [Clostridium sp. Marseille-P299]
MRNNEIFLKGLEELNIHLSEYQLEQFEKYYELLIEWNSFMNLTAITDYEEVLVKHFLDSLVISKVWNPEDKKRVLDMGTGAGFPGIPLKIAYPNLEIVLMDSLNKRIKFLNEVITTLDLKDIKAIHGRAEELGRNKEYRETFDLCVSRAVARLVSLSEFCIPFVKKSGYFIPYKSGKIKEELEEAKNAIQLLGGKLVLEESFLLPNTDVERTLVVINKVKETPSQYPRGGGKPLKAPLIKTI